jgi:hypothetical protein
VGHPLTSFQGMTISITAEGFIILLVAIVFHQMFEGLGLGSRIAAVPYPSNSWKPWVLVVAFGTTAPIGQAIGLLTRGSYDPNSAFGLVRLLYTDIHAPNADLVTDHCRCIQRHLLRITHLCCPR